MLQSIWDYLIKVNDGKMIAVMGLLMWVDMRKGLKDNLKSMSESLAKLTIQLAVIVERVDGHEKRINRLEGKDE